MVEEVNELLTTKERTPEYKVQPEVVRLCETKWIRDFASKSARGRWFSDHVVYICTNNRGKKRGDDEEEEEEGAYCSSRRAA